MNFSSLMFLKGSHFYTHFQIFRVIELQSFLYDKYIAIYFFYREGKLFMEEKVI